MPIIELAIDFFSEDSAEVLVTPAVDDDLQRQLELLLFCLYVARQSVNLGWPAAGAVDQALLPIASSPDRLLELADDGLGGLAVRPHSGAKGKGFIALLSCGPGFDFGSLDQIPDDEAAWLQTAQALGVNFSFSSHGFGVLGRGVNYYAPASVLVVLTELARRRRDEPEFLDRLAYAATELAHHLFTVANQLSMATFIAQFCWNGRFCHKCEKPFDRTLTRCPDCGEGYDPDENPETRTSAGNAAGRGDPLVLVDEYSKLRLEVTPLELRDGVRLADDEPAAGHRFVGVKLKVRNRTRRETDEVSSLDVELADDRGRRYEPEIYSLQPDFEDIASLSAGESTSGWLVFSLPRTAHAARLRYQVGIGDTGVWRLTPP